MNDFSTSGVNRRRAIILSIVAAVLIIGFLVYKGLDDVVNNEIDRTVVVTGSFTCLPTREGEKAERGCVLGVQSRDGSYYALDISRIQDANSDLKADDTIAVTGNLRPESEIKGSDWSSYDIKGIILVNTLLRTR
jgi:hypothetical protein